MEIVTNNSILRFFKTIKYFKIDLGNNLKGPVQRKKDPDFVIKIKDEFIKKYQTLTNRIIFKYGEIGSLKFYEDNSLKDEIHIYDKEKVYEILVKKEDLEKDATTYLTELLQSIEENSEVVEVKEISDNNSDIKEVKMVKNVNYTNMPDDIIRPDMKLPRDQYIEAMVKRRKLLSKL